MSGQYRQGNCMRHCWHLLMMLAWLACFSIAQAAVTVVPDKGEELLDQV